MTTLVPPPTNTSTLIKDLLQKNLFLKPEQREQITQKIPHLTEEKLKKIIDILQKGYESQRIVLKELLKRNPDILNKCKGSIRTNSVERIHTQENASMQEEVSILADLETQFKNL